MPKYTASTQKDNNAVDVKEDTPTTKTNEVYNTQIEDLKKKNEELMTQMAQLMDMFKNVTNSQVSKDAVPEDSGNDTDIINSIRENYTFSDVPQEVSPDKQIMVMSLCYGALSLSDNTTNKTIIKFAKYGEAKPILYRDLMSAVNSNRRFAETGKFYILDKNAVYYLGLSEVYKNIVSKDIIDNVFTYTPNVIESIIKSINKEQVDVIIKIICNKIFNKEEIDMNKVAVIERISGVDINRKVNEMRNFSKKE